MMEISFGCLSDPIRTQLEKQGLTLSDADADRIQKSADALTRVNLQGLVPERACLTGRKRLMKDISACARRIGSVGGDAE